MSARALGPAPGAGDNRPSGDSGLSGNVALAALGIVYGDLGTSPLYTLQSIGQALGGRFDAAAALGVLSLIFWTLILSISVKYCGLVMRADNHGEGGILALMSLVGGRGLERGGRALAVMGLLGAALIYGDGVITPAISVLSALEGVKVVTPALAPWVMPAAVLILVVLFALQRLGTARIGRAFGPIMLLWFLTIGALGLAGVLRHPQVLGTPRCSAPSTRAMPCRCCNTNAAWHCRCSEACSSASPGAKHSTRIWVTSAAARSAVPGTSSCCPACC